MRSNDRDGLCGGLTVKERDALLSPKLKEVSSDRATRQHDRAEACVVAVTRGADMLVWLVQQKLSVDEVAARLEVSPAAVYRAFVMLVPPSRNQTRTIEESAIARVLSKSADALRTSATAGLPHHEISRLLRTSYRSVGACLSALDQRDDALRRISPCRADEALELMQSEEARVRRESRSGLTLQDVIDMAGARIVAMHQGGTPLRQVAMEMGLCRETVRRAYREITGGAKTLTRQDMEEAA